MLGLSWSQNVHPTSTRLQNSVVAVSHSNYTETQPPDVQDIFGVVLSTELARSPVKKVSSSIRHATAANLRQMQHCMTSAHAAAEAAAPAVQQHKLLRSMLHYHQSLQASIGACCKQQTLSQSAVSPAAAAAHSPPRT